jgi:protein SCO1/2
VNRKALYAIIVALIIPLAIFLFVNSLPKANIPKPVFADSVRSVVKNGKQINDTFWHHLPDFTLTNQLGKQVSFSDVSLSDSGKIVVADFFFTHCPTICPPMTRSMKKLQAGIKKAIDVGDKSPDIVQFLSFSIDPERDSVPALKKWADWFQVNPENWWLLTGDRKKIYDLSINEMKLMATDGGESDSNFIHTDIFVLIDKHGVIRTRRDQYGNPVFYHGLDSTSMANLAEDIILLSLAKDQNKKSFLAGQLPVIAVAMLITLVAVIIFLILFRRKSTDR